MEEGAAESVVFEKADSNADSDSDSSSEEEKPLKVHLDKWLWAARFYKTLPLARKAIQSGKIYYNGHRSRSTVEISVGGLLKIQHGNVNRLVIILGLSTRRRSMKDAAALYQDISQHQETLSQGGIAASAQPPRYSQPSSSAYPGSHSGYGHGQSHGQGQGGHGHGPRHGQQSGQFRSPYQRPAYAAPNAYDDHREPDFHAPRGPSLFEEQQQEKPKRIIRFLRRPLQRPGTTAPLIKAEPETADAD